LNLEFMAPFYFIICLLIRYFVINYFIMKRYLLLILCFILSFSTVNSQTGKLLLIGGGSEKNTVNSWNKAAYTWAINKSENKKVAIISFGAADNWIPDYFKNSCGAQSAENFDISSIETADSQITYDALIACDVIFLKGGDQFNYYSTYKNTKTQQAIQDVYNRGGVICGTSAGLAVLSEVVYTAANSSAMPLECLNNPQHTSITLADDFFNFFPNYIFDTHFTIRARFPRMLAFMANWKFNHNENIVGIGVDEMTALAIDENKVGTVYGIGSANIYKAFYENTFAQSENKLIADSIQVTQLLQGCSIDFKTSTISGFSQKRTPKIKQETGNYTVLLSGSDELSFNAEFIDHLVNSEGQVSDKIVIITGNETEGNSYKSSLESKGATQIKSFVLSGALAENSEFKTSINSAKKILFIANEYSQLMSFLEIGSAGQTLASKIHENEMIIAFIGDNSRFAGHTVVEKYLTADAAYYGEIQCKKGLDLLHTSVIIPNTFKSADFYENTASAVPFAMLKDTLTFGIWLNQNNFLKYKPNTSQQKTYFHASGISPVMILKNKGTNSGFSVQTAYGDGKDNAPSFAGFENMTLSLIDKTNEYLCGNEITIQNTNSINSNEKKDFFLSISENKLWVDFSDNEYFIAILDVNGKEIQQMKCFGRESIGIQNYSKGIYFVKLHSKELNHFLVKKIVIP